MLGNFGFFSTASLAAAPHVVVSGEREVGLRGLILIGAWLMQKGGQERVLHVEILGRRNGYVVLRHPHRTLFPSRPSCTPALASGPFCFCKTRGGMPTGSRVRRNPAKLSADAERASGKRAVLVLPEDRAKSRKTRCGGLMPLVFSATKHREPQEHMYLKLVRVRLDHSEREWVF